MAWRMACFACAQGDHDNHVRDWNLRPGLIGGAWCDCEGQPGCKERAEAVLRRFLAETEPR